MKEEIYSNVSEWPCCPNCKSRELLIRGTSEKCLLCNYTSKDQINSRVKKLVMSKMCLEKISTIHFGPFPQVVDSDFGDMLSDKVSENDQEEVFENDILKAIKQMKKNGSFPTVSISKELRFDDSELMSLEVPIEIAREKLKRSSATKSAVIVFFMQKENSAVDFMTSDSVCGRETTGANLGFNVQIYGSPTISGFANMSHDKPEICWLHNTNCQDLIWYHANWNLIPRNSNLEAIRFFGVISITDEININLIVCEKLDGGIRGEIAIKDISAMTTVIKKISAITIEEMISKMKDKYEEFLKKARNDCPDNIELYFSKEWDLDSNINVIRNQIRALVCNKDGLIE